MYFGFKIIFLTSDEVDSARLLQMKLSDDLECLFLCITKSDFHRGAVFHGKVRVAEPGRKSLTFFFNGTLTSNIHYFVLNRPPVIHIMSQINPIYFIARNFSNKGGR
jgi:hypothetical protein